MYCHANEGENISRHKGLNNLHVVSHVLWQRKNGLVCDAKENEDWVSNESIHMKRIQMIKKHKPVH